MGSRPTPWSGHWRDATRPERRVSPTVDRAVVLALQVQLLLERPRALHGVSSQPLGTPIQERRGQRVGRRDPVLYCPFDPCAGKRIDEIGRVADGEVALAPQEPSDRGAGAAAA